uniref:Uncharacterized protein n=1 Tax=Candidatus Kentrum sp. DK TaxID=2126562 RepID=A0A450S2L6_9GAMM|nr:MAG: hypothetical protein BECKDK2373C_GA0170839_10138 [Candidatus Kentron sp. DK]
MSVNGKDQFPISVILHSLNSRFAARMRIPPRFFPRFSKPMPAPRRISQLLPWFYRRDCSFPRFLPPTPPAIRQFPVNSQSISRMAFAQSTYPACPRWRDNVSRGDNVSGQPNNNPLIINAYHLSMGGRGSRRTLFYQYFRLGGSLALPVRLLCCPIANRVFGQFCIRDRARIGVCQVSCPVTSNPNYQIHVPWLGSPWEGCPCCRLVPRSILFCEFQSSLGASRQGVARRE